LRSCNKFTGQLEVLEITEEAQINSRGFGAFNEGTHRGFRQNFAWALSIHNFGLTGSQGIQKSNLKFPKITKGFIKELKFEICEYLKNKQNYSKTRTKGN
jgi:hypothetical protein